MKERSTWTALKRVILQQKRVILVSRGPVVRVVQVFVNITDLKSYATTSARDPHPGQLQSHLTECNN